jgi:ATP-dependent DNA ligase
MMGMDSQSSDIVPFSGKIMYPPRPSRKIPPEKISDYEGRGWMAQLKFNGTRTLIELKPGEDPVLWTRHKEEHKAYQMTPSMLETLKELHETLDPNTAHVLDGELMHSKTKGIKDVIILFDILVLEGEYLIGTSALERYMFLYDEVFEPQERELKTGRSIALFIRENLWLAETSFMNFESMHNRYIDMDEVEGLVLKKTNGKLDRGMSKDNNGDWMIRCRKPHKNYAF